MAVKRAKSDKKPGRKAASTTNQPQPARLGLALFGFLIFLSGSAVLAGITVLFQRDAATQVADSRREESRLNAEVLANRLAAQLAEVTRRMDEAARDPRLAELITRADAGSLRQREGQFLYLFPGALGARLLPPGLNEVDMSASPPVSYAALDMLRQAETQATPPPAELHLFGTPQQHVTLVRRIHAGGQQIAGHLMVSFPVQEFQGTLDAPGPAQGYGELWQVISNGAPIAFAKRGHQALREGNPSSIVDVPGSRWKVAYWSEAEGTAGSGARFWLVSGLGIAVSGLLLALILGSFGRALRKDQAVLVGAVRDAREGRLQTRYPLQLRECTGFIEDLRRIFHGAGETTATPSTRDETKPAPAPATANGLSAAALEPSNIGVREMEVDPAIFRAYDIRGTVDGNLTSGVVYQVARAIGSEARARGEQAILIARDGRLSAAELHESLVRGLRASGVMVRDIGQVPTPLLYFATETLDTRSGVMLTGSHNPSEYNGMKVVLAGETLYGEAIQRLRLRIENGEFDSGDGGYEALDVVPAYAERIRQDVQVARPMKVVVDCGNGVAGGVAPDVLASLGCTVVPLYCEVDGRFPNHHPDPSRPENLADLMQAVRTHEADLGLAFDGDGDRLGVVASSGEIVWPDRVLMLFAMDVLGRNPGAEVIYDVKCTPHLAKIVHDFGGSPEMWQTGHSLIKARMKETGALLAGELSGHIFFKDRWYGFDDALYAAARLLETLSNDHRTTSSVFASLPDGVNTPELVLPMREGEPQAFMAGFLGKAQFADAEVTTIDGLRADFADGWGLVRASNTMPCLVIRFEGDTQVALERVQHLFRTAMLATEPKLKLPF